MTEQEIADLKPGVDLDMRIAKILRMQYSPLGPGASFSGHQDCMFVIQRISEIGKTVQCVFPGGVERDKSGDNLFFIMIGPFYREDQETPYTIMRATNDSRDIGLTVCQAVIEAESELTEAVNDHVD